jgi:hypothetical protein
MAGNGCKVWERPDRYLNPPSNLYGGKADARFVRVSTPMLSLDHLN